MRVRVGDKAKVWWKTGDPDGRATVLAVLPYTGRYAESFNCVLRLAAPQTHRGWLEMAYQGRAARRRGPARK